MTNPSPLINSAEACERLGIDRSTLSRWVSAGRIEPAIKLPGSRGPFLFTEESVESLRAETRAAS